MRNRYTRHDFRVTGGYDPAQDGPSARYGRVSVCCASCSETSRVFAGTDEVNAGGGCARQGPDLPWQRGDLLAVPGGRLDQFEAMLPSGRVATWNAGGQWGEWDLHDVTPWLPALSPPPSERNRS